MTLHEYDNLLAILRRIYTAWEGVKDISPRELKMLEDAGTSFAIIEANPFAFQENVGRLGAIKKSLAAIRRED